MWTLIVAAFILGAFSAVVIFAWETLIHVRTTGAGREEREALQDGRLPSVPVVNHMVGHDPADDDSEESLSGLRFRAQFPQHD